jgi:hypothetical protein
MSLSLRNRPKIIRLQPVPHQKVKRIGFEATPWFDQKQGGNAGRRTGAKRALVK